MRNEGDDAKPIQEEVRAEKLERVNDNNID